MTASALNAGAGAALFAAASVDLALEAWAAEGFQRRAASLVAFAGLALIVRGVVTMEPRLRARKSSLGRYARSAR
jgi:hypothetical protein